MISLTVRFFLPLQFYWNHTQMMKKVVISLILLAILAVCGQSGPPHTGPYPIADTIYHNGVIITMNDLYPLAHYVAVAGGNIIAVGLDSSEMKYYSNKSTVLVDLKAKTMIPGFVDAHSHFSLTAIQMNQGFDLSPPPFGSVTSIADIITNIQNYIASNNIAAGKIIYGMGYSDIDVIEHRHPSRFDLDAASTVNPICIRHFSNHIMTCNSLALSLVGYTDTTPNPPGGQIDHFPNGTIYGVTREWAIIPPLTKFGTNFWNLTAAQINVTTQHYISCGVTTAHDMLSSLIEPIVYHSLGNSFPIDINGYFWITSANLSTYQTAQTYATSRFRIAGTKFIFDGSIQAYTALLTQPYWVPPSEEFNNLNNYVYNTSRSCLTENCGTNDFAAPTLLQSLFLNFYQNGVDTIVHCNGDAASDNMIQAMQWARSQTNIVTDTRFVMLHSQTVRDDQLDQLGALGITPSFFPGHIYYWGDKHYSTFLGPSRANRMDPVASAIARNLTYTLHNDSPTIAMGSAKGYNTFIGIISHAVNRKTIKGRVLGAQLSITAYEALKGVTINSAWQARQSNIKGSIEVGKLADLVILSGNPTQYHPSSIADISVLTTIKEGKIIYGSLP